MHLLIAPNAFKHSLDAGEVAVAIDEGLKQSKLDCTTTRFPVGDGGDGTGALIIQHLNGETISANVLDPLGRKIQSSYGLVDNGKTAVIEMSDASGLRLLRKNELNPLRASSFGTGQLIADALNKNVHKIILCIGGSATVDGAAGVLQALGFQFLDQQGNKLDNLPEDFARLHSIDSSTADERITGVNLVILCDVQNLLLGKQGAAAVFGPQKGASPDDVNKLEAALSNLKDVVLKQTGKDISQIKHGGAAGGVAAALAGMINAELVNGIDYFLLLTGFDKELERADVVITGEGSIDIQTLQGKGPFGVAKKAKEKNLTVIALAGTVPSETNPELQKYFDILESINPPGANLSEAIKHTRDNLIRTAKLIGDKLSRKQAF